jgi:hypothetical protein
VLDNVVAMAGNSAATGEPPTGLVLDLCGTQQGWTVRNAVVLPVWNAVQPQLTVTAAGRRGDGGGGGFGARTGIRSVWDAGSVDVQRELHGAGDGEREQRRVDWDGHVTQGGVGCSGTTTASVNVAGTWDTAAPVNLIGGQNMTFFGGNLLKGNGGYTVWNAAGSTELWNAVGRGRRDAAGRRKYAALVANSPLGSAYQVDQFPGADFGAKLQACLGTVSASYGGTCDARNFTGRSRWDRT